MYKLQILNSHNKDQLKQKAKRVPFQAHPLKHTIKKISVNQQRLKLHHYFGYELDYGNFDVENSTVQLNFYRNFSNSKQYIV